MSFTNPKPLGYAYGEVLPSGHVNTVWANVANAIDGAGGGSYSLSAPLEIADQPVTIEELIAPSATATNLYTDNAFINGDAVLGLSAADTVTINGTGALKAPMVASGAGRTTMRYHFPGADADSPYGPKDYDFVKITSMSADRNYTINDTGAVDGDTIEFLTVNGTYNLVIKEPGGTNLTTITAQTSTSRNYAKCIRVSGAWIVLQTYKAL